MRTVWSMGTRVATRDNPRLKALDERLLAAGKVVGETLSAPRERRLVEEFLADVGTGARG